MKWGIVVAAVVSVLLAPGTACASSGEALVWEETRQQIPNGSEISLWEQFNLQGGAVAIGHPLGASGARIVASVVHQLRRRGGGLGIAAICSGGGQGDALLLRVG